MSPLRQLLLSALSACLLARAPSVLAEEPPPPVEQAPVEPPPAAPVAPAPPAPADPAKERARARFERGLELARAGAWDAAFAEFSASLELFPTRGALKNAALSLKELHRYDEALDSFEALLKNYPDLSAEDRALVARETAELRVRVGFIEVRTSEPGATILIDGKARGSAPLGPVRVSVSSRLVRVHKEGFVPFDQRVDLAGGVKRVVEARLRPLIEAGRLRVGEASGKSAKVFVDGLSVGKAPWEGTLAVGSHVVWLQGDAPRTGTQPALVQVKLNGLTGVSPALEAQEAVLRVEAIPATAQIAVDGVPITSGLWEGAVRSGGHLVQVSNEGYLTRHSEISLSAAERKTLSIRLDLDPESARFKAEHPPRIVFEAAAGVALAGALGKQLDAACSGSCDAGQSFGLRATLRGGYELGIGIGASLDVGYLGLGQSFERRALAAQPVGFPRTPGTVDDDLSLSLWTVGASIFYQSDRFASLLVRLGGGAAVGSFRDRRSGAFEGIGSNAPGAVDYRMASEQDFGAPHLYAEAELGAGYPIGERFELGVGLEGLLLVATKTARWDPNQSPFLAVCAPAAAPECSVSLATLPAEDLQSKSLLAGVLSVRARYAF